MVRPLAFFKEVALSLKNAGIEDPGFEARIILESVCGDDAYIKLITDRLDINEDRRTLMQKMTDRRVQGEPLQYIIGEWEFYGINFKVGKGVLIPRQDTETLVETALDLIKSTGAAQIVDLCSGTGCIPITLCLKKTDLKAFAVELYDEAFGYLCENVSLHQACVTPVRADVLRAETATDFSDVDVITANPPYLTKEDMAVLQKEVRHEPETALFGDDDGLHFYREISRLWKPALKDGGYIIFEIGITQAEDVSEILIINGYKNVRVVNDLTHRPRVVLAQNRIDPNGLDFANTVARVKRMEENLDLVRKTVDQTPEDIFKNEGVCKAVKELNKYSRSGLWLHDFERDEKNGLPRNLKRGILSEDLLYNLLCDVDEIVKGTDFWTDDLL